MKKIAIIALVAVVIGTICIKIYSTYHADSDLQTDLPVVVENTTTQPTVSVDPEGFTPDVPTDGIDVSGVTDTESLAEADARIKAEESQGPISQDDAALKAADAEAKRTLDAINNPQPSSDSVKGVDEGVKVTVPKKDTPSTSAPAQKKDAEGYIISKEQSIKDGAAALQTAIDTKSYDWTYSYGVMKDNGLSDDQIKALVQKAKTDPYSSTALTASYDFYRKSGEKSILLGQILSWICGGGIDTNYSGHGV